jgi:NarL family two-component system response regulator LiaR
MAAIRVLVADDHDVVREGIAGFLNAFDDLTLVGQAHDGAEAVSLCGQTQPDVILMDIVMPGMDGIEATQHILEKYPQVKIVILTSFNDEGSVQQGLQAGAISYLLKNASIHEMSNAIRAAYEGKSVLAPEAAQTLIKSSIRSPEPSFNLKERELEVLTLMVRGLTNPQIAEQLYLSRSTIKVHVSAILSKLGVESRTEAVAVAVKHGLVGVD